MTPWKTTRRRPRILLPLLLNTLPPPPPGIGTMGGRDVLSRGCWYRIACWCVRFESSNQRKKEQHKKEE